MENVTDPAYLGGSQLTAITDLRAVPLDQLLDDEYVRQMVGQVIGLWEDPSRISVATFNSAI